MPTNNTDRKRSICTHVEPEKAFHPTDTTAFVYYSWSLCPVKSCTKQASRSSPCRQEIVWFHEKISLRHYYKETDKRVRKTLKLAGIYCQDISVITLLSIRKEAELDRRRRPSTFENMPFLMQEDASLGARKASSSVQLVTY